MSPARVSPPPPPDLSAGLTPDQLEFWDTNGYLLIPDALSKETTRGLLNDAYKLLDDFSLDDHPMTKFSTGEKSDHVGDSYFLESGDKVRFFFEEGELIILLFGLLVYICTCLRFRLFITWPSTSSLLILDEIAPKFNSHFKTIVYPRLIHHSLHPLSHSFSDAFDANGHLTKPKSLAINKIGHYLHALHPSYASASLSPQNASIATSLGFRDPRVLQSMLICKQPEIGGRVPPHQDSTFLYTDPPSAVGFWYALEDCTVENGCLSFAAGSHKRAPIRSRFVRLGSAADGSVATGTGFIDNAGKQWPQGLEEDTEVKKEVYELGEVKAGTLVLIHGNLLHKSEKNTSMKGRMIYTFHVIEGGNEYDGRNWLQPPEKGLSKLFAEANGQS